MREVFFLARLVPIAEGIAAGWIAYALAARLFGRAAGLVAGGLWLSSPLVLGLARLDGLDLPFALVTGAACLCLSRHWRHPTPWVGATVVGVMGGVAILTRVTGLVLVGALALGVVAADRRQPARALARGALVGVVARATMWIGYTAMAPTASSVARATAACLVPASAASGVIDPIPWPTELEAGLRFHLTCSYVAAPGYLFGRFWTEPSGGTGRDRRWSSSRGRRSWCSSAKWRRGDASTGRRWLAPCSRSPCRPPC